MDEQNKALEATRRGQDAARDVTRKSQETARETTRVAAQAATAGVESMGAWADASQQVIAQLIELNAGVTKEVIGLYSEFQRSTLEVWRASQGESLRWQSMWLQWYQQAFGQFLQNAQRTSRLYGGSVEATTQALERLQTTAEQTGREMQDVFNGAAGKVREIYARAA